MPPITASTTMSIITMTIATISGRCQPQIGGSMTAESTDQPKLLIFFCVLFTLTHGLWEEV